MLKKIIANFYLPSPLAISGIFFIVSLVFAFSFTNPAWGSTLSDTAPSRMAYGAVVPFLFAASLVADCFAYFEKDMKEKPRWIFSLVVGIYEAFAILICFILYANFSPERVIASLFYPLLVLALALAGYGIFIRAVAEKKRKEHLDLEKETFFAMMMGCFFLGFFPLWNLLILGSENYNSAAIGVGISLLYLIYGLTASVYSLLLIYVPTFQKYKMTSMSVLSGGAIVVGAVGIVLATIYHDSGRGFAVQSSYWIIASGLAYFIIGVIAFFYNEIRKASLENDESH